MVAVLASLLLHAGIGLALTRLPCRGAEAAPPQCAPTCFVLSGPLATGGGPDKLLAGQHPSSTSTGLFTPSGVEIPIPVTSIGSAQLGPAIGGVPGNAGSTSGPPAVAGSGEGGNGANGDGFTTSFFGVATRSAKVVYVLDRSGSMGEKGRLDAAKQELLSSLRQLPADASFQVIVYNSMDDILVGHADELVPATPENVGCAAEALRDLEPVGGTKHLPALTVALRMRPDVIYFLTDADDLTEAEQITITRLNTTHAVFHTIELTRIHCGSPGMPMQVLARTTGGTYTAIDLTTPR